MHSPNDSAKLIQEVIKNEKILTFVKKTLTYNYTHFFSNHAEEVETLINQSFFELDKAKDEINTMKNLKKVAGYINKNIYQKDNPTFWFNEQYQYYKKNIRPQNDLKKIKQFFNGQTILDFGCGAGYLSLEIQKAGYNVYMTDVLDYRIPEAKAIPFAKMTSPTDMPYSDKSIDVSIIKTVLHHVDEENILPIIKEFNRISDRLIIEEDTYAIENNYRNVESIKEQQPHLREFLSLTKAEQFQFLLLIDYYANAIALGQPQMNFPFQYRTVPEWEQLLKAGGYTVTDVLISGFEEGKIHTNCQVWIICDKIN